MSASELGLETLRKQLERFRNCGKDVVSEEVSVEFVWREIRLKW